MKLHKQHNAVIEPARTDWIAVGDASRFIIYKKRKGETFAPVKTFTNPGAHLKVSEFESDQPGRSFDSHTRSNGSHLTGPSRHAYTSQQDPKEHAIEEFAREVTAFLDKSHKDHLFNRLILVANSRLLGRLRSLLDKKTQEAVSAEHTKDFSWITGQELDSRIQSLIALH